MDESCKIIAITNQKGGVGKTTTTLNLGVGLARQGKRVLLVDCDPQGSLTSSTGISSPDELDKTLSELLTYEITGDAKDFVNGFSLIESFEGVHLIPSNISLSGTESALSNCLSRESVLKRTLDSMKNEYDYILIDCMPSLGLLNINAIVAADSIIIPCEPTFLSTKGLNLLLGSVSRVKRQINPNLQIDGVLLTMVDSRTNNAKDITAALKSELGTRIHFFDTYIPRSVKAQECPVSGSSIYTYEPNCKVAQAYESLSKEVIKLDGKTKDKSRNVSLR